MTQQGIRTVSDGVRSVSFVQECKAVKNINLRIRRDGSVYVSANRRVSQQRIDDFVRSKLDFVLAAQQKVQEKAGRNPGERHYETGEIYKIMGKKYVLEVRSHSTESVFLQEDKIILQLKNPQDEAKRRRLMENWWNSQCQIVFGEYMQQILPLFTNWCGTMPQLRLRDMTSRWGTCMPVRKIITLNKRLLCAPPPCIQYVVLHEFCHFVYQDHSPRFHALMTGFMPDWKQRKKLLEQTADF